MFKELDHRSTPQGDLVLRRHRALSLGGVLVYEVTLDGEFLMSSLVDASERALATLPLGSLTGRPAHVLVAGLGLGATAHAVLGFDHVQSLTVVERSPAVIEWHRRGLVPLAGALQRDRRCRIVAGDFFALVAAGRDLPLPRQTFTAVLVDIDHSPRHLLDPSHAALYEIAGLQRLRRKLEPGGLFALWSAERPDATWLARLGSVFDAAGAEVVRFRNPLVDVEDANTIYIGRAAMR